MNCAAFWVKGGWYIYIYINIYIYNESRWPAWCGLAWPYAVKFYSPLHRNLNSQIFKPVHSTINFAIATGRLEDRGNECSEGESEEEKDSAVEETDA